MLRKKSSRSGATVPKSARGRLFPARATDAWLSRRSYPVSMAFLRSRLSSFFFTPTLNTRSIRKKKKLTATGPLARSRAVVYATASVRPDRRPRCSRARPYARTRQTDTAPAAKARAYEIRVSMGDVGYMAPSSGQGRIVENYGRSAPNPLFKLVRQGVCARGHLRWLLTLGVGNLHHRKELLDHALRFLV